MEIRINDGMLQVRGQWEEPCSQTNFLPVCSATRAIELGNLILASEACILQEIRRAIREDIDGLQEKRATLDQQIADLDRQFKAYSEKVNRNIPEGLAEMGETKSHFQHGTIISKEEADKPYDPYR